VTAAAAATTDKAAAASLHSFVELCKLVELNPPSPDHCCLACCSDCRFKFALALVSCHGGVKTVDHLKVSAAFQVITCQAGSNEETLTTDRYQQAAEGSGSGGSSSSSSSSSSSKTVAEESK